MVCLLELILDNDLLARAFLLRKNVHIEFANAGL
jgi:hypothetical protein